MMCVAFSVVAQPIATLRIQAPGKYYVWIMVATRSDNLNPSYFLLNLSWVSLLVPRLTLYEKIVRMFHIGAGRFELTTYHFSRMSIVSRGAPLPTRPPRELLKYVFASFQFGLWQSKKCYDWNNYIQCRKATAERTIAIIEFVCREITLFINTSLTRSSNKVRGMRGC